jgi:hypothetical protein
VISVELARHLRDAGLRWDNPSPGDCFIVADRNMDDQVFVLSDMTVDVHEFPTGRVIGFNGTVEWALDSVEHSQALWLPNEAQLRERLGGAFVALERDDAGFRVALRVAGSRYAIAGQDADSAYGRALLFLITGEEPG